MIHRAPLDHPATRARGACSPTTSPSSSTLVSRCGRPQRTSVTGPTQCTPYFASVRLLDETLTDFAHHCYSAGTLTNSSGSEAVGATRTYEAGGLSISEQLVYVEPNSTTGSLRQRWNSTKALTVAGIDIYTFTDDLTVYRNTTTNETNVQVRIMPENPILPLWRPLAQH